MVSTRMKTPQRSRRAIRPQLNGQLNDYQSCATAGAPSADEVRVAAYHKWVMAGCPSGDGVDFWLDAEQELRQANIHASGTNGEAP